MIKKIEAYKKAIQLKTKGLHQKEISQILEIPEKTISKWMRNSPERKAFAAMQTLLDRLSKETLTPDEVAKMTDSISKLHKVANSQTF